MWTSINHRFKLPRLKKILIMSRFMNLLFFISCSIRLELSLWFWKRRRRRSSKLNILPMFLIFHFIFFTFFNNVHLLLKIIFYLYRRIIYTSKNIIHPFNKHTIYILIHAIIIIIKSTKIVEEKEKTM